MTSNHLRYRTMMERVHAPAELLGKVKGLPMEKKRSRPKLALRYATATMAVIIGTFAITNGVSYAATGETWIEKAVVMVNGQPREMDVQMAQDGDTTIGEVTYETADGSGTIDFTLSVEGGDVRESTMEITDYTAPNAPTADPNASDLIIEMADGRVLLAPEGTDPIDLTDALKTDGAATGSFYKEGLLYMYQVGGSKGAYWANVKEA